MELGINFGAVFVAGIAAMTIGAIWYSPIFGFGKIWMRLMGWGGDMPRDKKGEVRSMILNFIAVLVEALVLSYFGFIWGAADVASALEFAFFVWLGFVAATSVGSVLWERRPVGLYVLNVSYHLVSILAMSLIVSLWT